MTLGLQLSKPAFFHHTHHLGLLNSQSLSHLAPWEEFCFSAFTGTAFLGIIANVIKQEPMSFTGNFP
jgi:hypothetical protein